MLVRCVKILQYPIPHLPPIDIEGKTRGIGPVQPVRLRIDGRLLRKEVETQLVFGAQVDRPLSTEAARIR